MIRRHRWLWILAVTAAIVIGAVAVGVRTFLPSWVRTRIERDGSAALGREMRIAGAFTLSLSRSLTPTLLAEGVTLANAPWGSEPFMVRVARVKASVDLASLWTSPVRIKELEIEGVRILIETGPAGRGNWSFETKPAPDPPQPPEASAHPPVVFDRVAIRNLELVRRERHEAPPLRVGVARLDARVEPTTGMIDISAAGQFNDAPWDVTGQLGRLDHLYELRDVAPALTGNVGNVTFALRGRIRDPLALGDPNFEAEIDGPDIAAALKIVGLRSPVSGPFHLKGRASPSSGGVDLDLTAGLAGVTVAARGRVSALLKPDAIDAKVEASGPDAAVVGAWMGVDGLPPRPFTLAGRFRRDGPWASIEDTLVRVGGISAVVSGAIGEPPRCVGTDLAVTGAGPDLSELSALTHLRLPAGGFKVRGRFLRRADGLAVEDVDIRVKNAIVQGGGTIGEVPRCENLDMTVSHASGPDLSWFSGIARVELPQEPFTVRGRVARRGAVFDLDGIEGRLRDDTVTLQGSIVPAPRLAGTNLRGRVAGPDFAKAASLAGLHGIPSEPYDVSGQVVFASDGYQLEGVEARVGRMSATVSGRLGERPAEDGTALDCRLEGPALSDLAAWSVPAGLPDDPFVVSGRLRIENHVYRVERMIGEVRAGRAVLDGTLGPLPDLSPLDVEVEISGPDLSDIGHFVSAAGREPPKRLPAEPYTISGRVRRIPAGFELHGARVTVGNAEIRLDGAVGSGEKFSGTDVRFEARAPDASVAAALAGVTFPAGPIELHGRIEHGDSGFRLDGVATSIGDAHAEISGVLGELPTLAGADLDLRVAGPDLAAVLGPVARLSPLPAEPFEASAHVEGSLEQFQATHFAAVLGGSDLEGSVSVRLGGRPYVAAELRSGRLDIPQLLEGFVDGPAATPASPQLEKGPSRKRGRFIPDEALALDALRSLDGQVRLTTAELVIPGRLLHDVVIAADLQDGALRVNGIDASDESGGRVTASLSLEPVDAGYRLQISGGIAGGTIDFSKPGQVPDHTPPIDVEFTLEGAGRSLHAIAASADGRALITWGAGRVPSNVAGFVTSDVLQGLLDALNPFRKSSPDTTFECGVVAVNIENGKVVVEPIATSTDKLIVIGRGRIDLDTEQINLVWTLKPRTGVGITASSIVHPYIKLGGTLSSPSLNARPLQALASSGAAVVTSGLTLLLRGVYDRITAERKVCINALDKVRRQVEEREDRKLP